MLARKPTLTGPWGRCAGIWRTDC